jgi:peptidoglycan/LPS O-acetylase OafA/YrhL
MTIGGRNDQLDGLRGYAASGVIIYHCFGNLLKVPPLLESSSIHDAFARALVAIFNGDAAVQLFFVMSGAVLMSSLQRSREAPWMIVRRFAIERFFRLFPALIVCVLVTAALWYAIGSPPSVEAVVDNLMLYQPAIVGQTWTLNAEVLAIPFILASYLVFRSRGLVWLLVLDAALLTMARHLPHHDVLYFLRASAYCFVLGMLIPTPLGRRVATLLPSSMLWLVMVLMLFVPHLTSSYVNSTNTVRETLAACVVTMLFYKQGGAIGAWFERPHAVFLGRISYSLYLFNILFLILLAWWLPTLLENFTITRALLLGSVVLLGTIPLAAASQAMIEQPTIQLGRCLTGRRPPLPELRAPSVGA